MKIDFSIVIPTWNRKDCVREMLRTLYEDRQTYEFGESEVLVVDSSKDEEQSAIREACEKYDARYIDGVDSVRKKRNKGITEAKYDYIFFIDSDVIIDKGMLNEHAKVYLNSQKENLGGVFGVTEFYGTKSFRWNIIEYSNYTFAFEQAKKYPYASWTIGNNVSFVKQVLLDIGMFEENLPFKLGGDDMDLSYRVVKSGHPIKCTPYAITHHSRETWDSNKALNDRTRRWGTMEYYNAKRHAESVHKTLPGLCFVAFITTLFMIAAMILTRSFVPAVCQGIFLAGLWMISYICDSRKSGKYNLLYYSLAKLISFKYAFYKFRECVKQKDFSVLNKQMIFNDGHAKADCRERSQKLSWAMILFTLIVFGATLLGKLLTF
ncbi:MAG: glycosyltransferase [Clostridia bacterium]|nr:glycosyltransferase [Clostridia bacterium]